MILTLVGMSGSGKTYWSKKLARKGFVRYCCDDFIEALLSNYLKKHGYRGIQDVAKWLGQPFEPQYISTSQAYLQAETKVMEYIAKKLKSRTLKGNVVIDTTGSVIYVKKAILEWLATYTTVVYLETPKFVQETMFHLYLQDPKPVIWGEIFRKKNGEANKETLARCYPQLLQFRSKAYKRLADITIDYYMVRKPGFSTKQFIQLLTTS